MTPEPKTEADFVECTTRSLRRRHWSPKPQAQQWGIHPLCNTWPDGIDQSDADRMYGGAWIIADLPPCKQCAKSKQRRIDGRPA